MINSSFYTNLETHFTSKNSLLAFRLWVNRTDRQTDRWTRCCALCSL